MFLLLRQRKKGAGHPDSLRQSCSHESATGTFGSCGTRSVRTPRPFLDNRHPLAADDSPHFNPEPSYWRGAERVPRAVPHDENAPVARFPKPRTV
ncbi:hypothetical protein DMP11_01490 [Parvibacter caecicola]|nr:hypothetical protein DMP11_01490 [Parvibacter caecicola]